jgi:hypothetical protein
MNAMNWSILNGRISIFRMRLKSHAGICDRADGTRDYESHRLGSILFQRISIRCTLLLAKI